MMPKSLGVAVVFALLVSMISTPAQAVLVASYEFEGNLNDSSGNGHTGVFVGTTSIVNDPMRGQVLNIPQTGNQGVNINTINPIPQFAANSSITLMAWYKRDAVTPITGDYRYVVDLGQNGNNPIASLGIRINGRITSYIETDEPTPNGDQVDVIGQTAVEGNAAQWAGWHHLAVVHDRSDDLARVYLDGVLDQEVSISDVRDDYAFTWTGANIGRGPEGASSIAYGLIDDVKIYSHALSLEEVRAAAGITEVAGTIDRSTGALTLTNIGGTAAAIASYSLSSPSGALDAANWQSVTDHWDNGGPGSIDTDPWVVESATYELLSESESPAVNGGMLAPGATLTLGTPWIRTPHEDVTLNVTFRNGLTTSFPVVFEGGLNGDPFVNGDLNFDGVIDQDDWTVFASTMMSDLSHITSGAWRYTQGDLNGDGLNDASDFAIFKREYEAANGAGSFAAAIAAQPVPEPATVACGLLVASSALLLRRRRSRSLEG